jgi:hypothetical protein
MPKKGKKATSVPFNPADFVDIAKSNPYVHRLIEDQSIRDNIQKGVDSSRKAIDRLSSGKNPAKTLLEDKRLQADLRMAIEAIRDATTALTESQKKARSKRRGRKLLLIGVAAAAALAGSEGLRSKLLDTLFGAEEEFQYTPPAGAPATPSPSPVSAA